MSRADTKTRGLEMQSYRKNEMVVTRLNLESGIIIDCENDVRFGWLYQIQFANGAKRWFKSCEIAKS